MHLLTREGYALHALPFGITLNHDVGASSLALLAAPYHEGLTVYAVDFDLKRKKVELTVLEDHGL